MVHKTPGCSRPAVWIAAILVSRRPDRIGTGRLGAGTGSTLLHPTRRRRNLRGIDSVRPAAVSDAERGTHPRHVARGRQQARPEYSSAEEGRCRAARARTAPTGSGLRHQGHRGSAGRRGFARSRGRAGLRTGARSPRRRRASGPCGDEIGHEYFWGEYFRARRDTSQSSLRRLELLCDGFAVITLAHAGVNPERLTSALEKTFDITATGSELCGTKIAILLSPSAGDSWDVSLSGLGALVPSRLRGARGDKSESQRR